MAVKYLVGTSSVAWEATNFYPTGIPASGDELHVTSSARLSLIGSLDRTGDNPTIGLNLALLHIHSGASVSIGAPGNPLKCTCDKIIHEGDGTLFFESRRGATSTNLTDLIIVNSPNLIVAAEIGGDIPITRHDLIWGVVEHRAGTIDKAFMLPTRAQRSVAPTLNQSQGTSGSIGELFIGDGFADLQSAGIVHLAMGSLRTTQRTGLLIATLYQTGGRTEWDCGGAPTSPTGDPLIYLLGGTFEIVKNTVNQSVIATMYKSASASFPNPGEASFTGSLIELGL